MSPDTQVQRNKDGLTGIVVEKKKSEECRLDSLNLLDSCQLCISFHIICYYTFLQQACRRQARVSVRVICSLYRTQQHLHKNAVSNWSETSQPTSNKYSGVKRVTHNPFCRVLFISVRYLSQSYCLEHIPHTFYKFSCITGSCNCFLKFMKRKHLCRFIAYCCAVSNRKCWERTQSVQI